MSMREAFLQILSGQPTDAIVWTADISYWVSAERRAGRGDPAWDTEEGSLRLHQELGVMPYYWYSRFWLGRPVYDDTVEILTQQDGATTRRIWRTPLGDLVEESVFLPESCSTGVRKHAVQSERDLDLLLYLLEHRHLQPDCIDDYAQRLELWERYDGVPCIALPRAPMPAFLVEWSGVQDAFYLLMDHPAKVERVLELMEAQQDPILDATCELAPPVVHFPDNLTSESLTSLYDAYLAPTHRKRVARLHAVGTRCAVHLDGTVRGLLPKLAASGIDAVEALTPAPVGDVSVEEMRAVAASESVVLWGGAPGAMFAPPYTWDAMGEHIEQTLRAWSGTPYVLGVADQVPPDGEIDFCRRIAELVRDFRA